MTVKEDVLGRGGALDDDTGPQGNVKMVRVISRLNIGGPAIHAILLTRGLAERGYETLLVAGQCNGDDGDMSYILKPGDPIRWISEMSRSVRPLKNLQALWKVWRLIRTERPLIVHTHTAMAGCLGRTAAILSGVPIVIHTFHGNSLKHYFSPLMSCVFLLIERLLARYTDAMCVVSAQQACELSGEFAIASREKFRVIPLGLDLDPYLSLSVPMRASGGSLNVGWLGRLVRIKNIPLLLEVLERTLSRKVNIRLFIAGDGPEHEAVKRAVERFRDRVAWVGWQQDVVPMISQCHVLIQTSYNEGTPVALIQGMAAGRPFLSTAVGGVVDMTCGKPRSDTRGARWFDNCVLVEPEPEAFACVLAECARSPGRVAEMGQAARAFAFARYRKEALISNLDALYRELLERKLPHPQTARRTVSTQA